MGIIEWPGSRIRKLRQKMEVTQGELAIKVGSTGGASTVGRWEATEESQPSGVYRQRLNELAKCVD